jgi:hypothetical protein
MKWWRTEVRPVETMQLYFCYGKFTHQCHTLKDLGRVMSSFPNSRTSKTSVGFPRTRMRKDQKVPGMQSYRDNRFHLKRGGWSAQEWNVCYLWNNLQQAETC